MLSQQACFSPATPSLCLAHPPKMQEERAHANRLQAAYRRCFALAQEKHAAGDHETAADLRMKVSRQPGMRYKELLYGFLWGLPAAMASAHPVRAVRRVTARLLRLPSGRAGRPHSLWCRCTLACHYPTAGPPC